MQGANQLKHWGSSLEGDEVNGVQVQWIEGIDWRNFGPIEYNSAYSEPWGGEEEDKRSVGGDAEGICLIDVLKY